MLWLDESCAITLAVAVNVVLCCAVLCCAVLCCAVLFFSHDDDLTREGVAASSAQGSVVSAGEGRGAGSRRAAGPPAPERPRSRERPGPFRGLAIDGGLGHYMRAVGCKQGRF